MTEDDTLKQAKYEKHSHIMGSVALWKISHFTMSISTGEISISCYSQIMRVFLLVLEIFNKLMIKSTFIQELSFD